MGRLREPRQRAERHFLCPKPIRSLLSMAGTAASTISTMISTTTDSTMSEPISTAQYHERERREYRSLVENSTAECKWCHEPIVWMLNFYSSAPYPFEAGKRWKAAPFTNSNGHRQLRAARTNGTGEWQPHDCRAKVRPTPTDVEMRTRSGRRF